MLDISTDRMSDDMSTLTADQPFTWSMTVQAKPQSVSEFESVLLAMAGHDLRQPLQAIQSAHELLGLGARTEAELRLLRRGQIAIDRLRDQLDQILSASRLRAHAGEVELTAVHLGPLLQQACHENAIAAIRKGISLRVVPTTLTVRSIAVLLCTVLRNLVSNAIKYTPPGGRVLLGCRHVGQSIRIDVYDTGSGLTVDQMPRIFDSFTGFDLTGQDGLGIGLHIVRQAVAILGHRIHIVSAPSRGSRFSIFAARVEGVDV